MKFNPVAKFAWRLHRAAVHGKTVKAKRAADKRALKRDLNR